MPGSTSKNTQGLPVKATVSAVAASLATIFLSACGGGGDSSAFEITADNYVEVAGIAAGASDVALGATQLPRSSLSGTASASSYSLALSARTLEALQRATALERAQGITTTTGTCLSGTSTVVTNDANNNNIVDAGDSVTVTDNACRRNFPGEVSSGSVRIVLHSLAGSVASGSTSYRVDATLTLNDLRSQDGINVSVLNGGIRFTAARTDFRTGRDVVVIDSLTDASTDVGATTRTTLSGFTASIDYAPSEMTLAVQGTVTDSELGGTYVLSTPVPLRQTYLDDFPYAGAGKVTGSSGRSVTVTARDAVQARITADLNGDGVDDSERTVDRSWRLF